MLLYPHPPICLFFPSFSALFFFSTFLLSIYYFRVAIYYLYLILSTSPLEPHLPMSQEPDALGLDKPIKLGRVSKIPKITDELLFDRVRGLPHVITNYKKVARTIRKNDKALAQKAKDPFQSKSSLHQFKVETECQNLESVLQFYQLWCHGLFPKATFSDCIQMVRKYKSPRIRMYRRELIEQEIHRQKVEKGIITEDADIAGENDDLYDTPQTNGIAAVDDEIAENNSEAAVRQDEDDEDWGFLSVRRRPNGLFIGDEDDEEQEQVAANAEDAASTETSSNPSRASAIVEHEEEYPDVPDSVLQEAENDKLDDKFDDELEIMREMGM